MFTFQNCQRIGLRPDIFATGYSPLEMANTWHGLTADPVQNGLLMECANSPDEMFKMMDDEYNPGEPDADIEREQTIVEAARSVGYSEQHVFEAVRVKRYSQTSKTMLALARVLNHSMADKSLTVGEAIIGKPKKSGLFATVTVQLPISDGQVITIIFHSPDSQKRNITGADEILAFKWMLNKRDITVAVSPEGNADISLNQVGRRVSMLIERNSARFQKSQKDIKAQRDDLATATTDLATGQDAIASGMDAIATADKFITDVSNSQINLNASLAAIQSENAGLQAKLTELQTLATANQNKGKVAEPNFTPAPAIVANAANNAVAETPKQSNNYDPSIINFNTGDDITFTPLDNGQSAINAIVVGFTVSDHHSYNVRLAFKKSDGSFGYTNVDTSEGKITVNEIFEHMSDDKKLISKSAMSGTSALPVDEPYPGNPTAMSELSMKYDAIKSRLANLEEQINTDPSNWSGYLVSLDTLENDAKAIAMLKSDYDEKVKSLRLAVIAARDEKLKTYDEINAKEDALIASLRALIDGPIKDPAKFDMELLRIQAGLEDLGGGNDTYIQKNQADLKEAQDVLQELIDSEPVTAPAAAKPSPFAAGEEDALLLMNDLIAGNYDDNIFLYNEKLNEVASTFERIGVMDKYDVGLNSAADHYTELLKKA